MGRKNLVLKITIIVLLSWGIIFFHATPAVQWLREKTVGVLAPLARGAAGAGLRLGLRGRGLSRTEAAEIRAENTRLIAENFDREKLAIRVRMLEEALEFKDALPAPLMGARVLSYAASAGRETLLIDRGLAEGVKKGDLAVDEHAALVGEVSEEGDNSSGVLIASNAGVSFPGALYPAGGAVLVKGIGARTFSVELIPRGALVRRGDFLLRVVPHAAGSHRTILAGIITGETPGSSGVFKAARATLLARPEASSDVFIISVQQ